MEKITLICIIAATILVATADLEEGRAKLRKAHEECQADPKTKVGEDFMRKRARGEPVDDENKKAHVLCMGQKLGHVDAQGKPVEADIKRVLKFFIKDDAKLEEAVKKCNVEKENAEETADYVWNCLSEHAGDAMKHQEHH